MSQYDRYYDPLRLHKCVWVGEIRSIFLIDIVEMPVAAGSVGVRSCPPE